MDFEMSKVSLLGQIEPKGVLESTCHLGMTMCLNGWQVNYVSPEDFLWSNDLSKDILKNKRLLREFHIDISCPGCNPSDPLQWDQDSRTGEP